MSRRIVLEFPAEIPGKELQDIDTLRKGKTIIILELLRKGKISQGKASELLEVGRNEILDLMAEYNIPQADFPLKELLHQINSTGEAKQK